MNSRQESKLNMYHAVIAHCDANPTIVATVAAFNTLLTAFKAKTSSLETTAQQEAQVITGIATDKKVMRETLCQQAADLAAVVFSFAASQADNTLKESVDFSKSDLRNLKDDELAPACRNIHDAANTNLAALATYGITAPMLAAFNDLIDDYDEAVPAPRNAAALRKTYGTTLKNLIKECDAMLNDQMDTLAVQYKTANLEFYTTYKNNRIILDAATSNTKVEGIVTSRVVDPGLSGVTVSADGTSYSTTTDANGNYSLKIPVPGTYTINFTKTGFTPKSGNVEITLGQTSTLNISLSPL